MCVGACMCVFVCKCAHACMQVCMHVLSYMHFCSKSDFVADVIHLYSRSPRSGAWSDASSQQQHQQENEPLVMDETSHHVKDDTEKL